VGEKTGTVGKVKVTTQEKVKRVSENFPVEEPRARKNQGKYYNFTLREGSL